MQLTTLLSALTTVSLATAASIAPRQSAPKGFKVLGYNVIGSGCPSGTAEILADSTNTYLDIWFSDYIVQSGPGVDITEWRKNCRITLNLEFDKGYSVSALSTDLRGYADIPSDAKGVCQNVITFSGQSGEAKYGVTLPSGYRGDFAVKSSPNTEAWSACGGSTAIVNVNTQCAISRTEKRGLIAVDQATNRLSVRLALKWKQC